MVRQKTVELLRYVDEHVLHGEKAHLAITGSAGLGVAQSADLPFVQEVFATQLAVTKWIPNADCVVELGGEDAKILFLTGGTEVRMNGSCAGGTGAFIDQMATLLAVSLEELDDLAQHYEKIYTIASRCGVFAKSDIQPLLNQGAQKNDIAASIFQSVVNQTIGGLAQGRTIGGNVVFLGGPLTYFQGLRARFVETLDLDESHAIFPENSQYFIAMGAAQYSEKEPEFTLADVISQITNAERHTPAQVLPPLFVDEKAYQQFLEDHAATHVGVSDITAYAGDAYLGIDAGSTTTKIVLIDKDANILYSKYASNAGNPIPVVKSALEEIYAAIGERITIRSAVSTGYGEELIQKAFHLDYGLVETVAHYTAAKKFMPNVDFIIDIGGQDIKCFKIRNDAIDSIMLNEACSSGCGSFLETFANALGLTVEQFSREGLFAEHPVDLGSRCTVFMNSSVKQAQKDGATVGDISAGLSASVVKNAVYKVIRAASPKDLGEHIVVQGGTFLNDAVLRSFERELGVKVVRPNIAGLMGAYGVALFGMTMGLEKSSVLSLDALAHFTHEVTHKTCELCTNHCKLTVNDFGGGELYISGNRCERPLGQGKAEKSYNLMEYKYQLLRSYKPQKGFRGRIGIPMGLNMYELLPFWHTFFTKLGFEVVTSPRSTRKLYQKGQHTIPSDTVCYPAKLLHGHIESLYSQKVDAVFYPCMSYNFDEQMGDNHYNCPVVAYYPEVINVSCPPPAGMKLMIDYVGIHRRKDFTKKIREILAGHGYEITAQEIKHAVDAAYQAYDAHMESVRTYGEEALRFARENDKQIIVLAGRPYHIDPEINHGIDKLIESYGVVVVTEDCVSPLDHPKRVNVLNQWTYHSRLYAAAEYAVKHDDVQLVQLVSFGCGLDAITTDEVRSILETGGKLYTQIKIDEVNNLGAVKIRLRSLLAAIGHGRSKDQAV